MAMPWLITAVALIATVLILDHLFPNAIETEAAQMDLIYNLIVLVALGGSLLAHWRSVGRATIRAAALWLAVALGLVALYAFKSELGGIAGRISVALLPTSPRVGPGGGVEVRAANAGHYYIDTKVNGRPIRFLIDTGSSSVVLTRADAKRLGFDPDQLRFNLRVSTAGGDRWSAPLPPIVIDIGPIQLRGIRANVSDGGLSGSLLGMSALDQLRGYEVRDGVLTLRP
ncbi:MAG: TIGR02281 family clan AA aspartic protease [Alphaproteobacteria bacterium]|nr:TIGR02281 family clan AA aspartic protease [Alphaproteobacteria bacterium]